MRLTDAVPAAVMLVLAVVMVVGTLSLGVWQGFTPGPAFFPVLIGAFTAVLAVQLLVAAFRPTTDDAAQWPDRTVLRAVGSVYGLLIGFFVMTPIAGMLLAIVAFLLIVMIGILRQPFVGSLFATAITTGLIYLVFVRWLSLPLPEGPFGF